MRESQLLLIGASPLQLWYEIELIGQVIDSRFPAHNTPAGFPVTSFCPTTNSRDIGLYAASIKLVSPNRVVGG